MSSKLAIGIDLGTTNTCVGVCRDYNVEVIPNGRGEVLTPSYVTFTNNERLVGQDAKALASYHPKNTIFDAKRLIGRRFDDPDLKKDMKYWPFQVINISSVPKINVTVNGKLRAYFPEEISSMILGYIKDSAEKFLNQPIQNCVITVPAYFNDSQRQATMDAGKIAGLNVMRIINEPTAAALAFGLKENPNKRNVLVYDLGGGTFDVSILRIVSTNIKVLATGGNTHLGGGDFDTNMMEYFIDEFQENNNFNLINDNRALRRLRTHCEKAKEILSTASETIIEIEDLANDYDLYSVMTREKFEDLNIDLFNLTIKVITKCLEEARLDKSNIDEIVMVGGSTRIPKIQSLVRDYFDGKQLNKSINPDEAVACGAAIQASIIQNEKSKIPSKLSISDVISLSLGIRVQEGKMSIVVQKNTPIPYRKTKEYLPGSKSSTNVLIEVYEGEETKVKDNNLLGKFALDGFKSRMEANSKFDVTFDVDENSILTVTCLEIVSGSQKQIKINTDKGRLTEEDFKLIQIEETQFRNEDAARKNRIDLRNKLIDYCYEIKDKHTMYQAILDKCEEIIDWTDENRDAIENAYHEKYNELTKYCEEQLLRFSSKGQS